MKIDLALSNDKLYNGCKVGEVAGRLNLTTPVDEAVGIVGRNKLPSWQQQRIVRK